MKSLMVAALTGLSFPVLAQQPPQYDRLVRELQAQDLSPSESARESISNIEQRVREGGPGYWPIEVPKPPAASRKPISAETVSKKRLAHKPPKAARHDFDQGLQALEKGKNGDAIRFFSEAVRLDPGYWDAHRFLADSYGRQGRAMEALQHLEAASAIDPNSATLQSYMARALLALKRPAEAEAAARRALQFAPSSEADHYLLAIALLAQDLQTEEALKHLAIASHAYPVALDALVRLCEQLSRRKR